MSEKLKNDQDVTFTVVQQVGFYSLWIVLGVIGTAVLTGLALAALVTFGRDAVFAVFAGNLGNLILNLIAFALFGVGLSIAALVVYMIGIYEPWKLYADDETQKPMKALRQDIIRRRFDHSAPDSEAS